MCIVRIVRAREVERVSSSREAREYVYRVSPNGVLEVPEVYVMTMRYATVVFEHTELS
jgi:hypothetical protein